MKVFIIWSGHVSRKLAEIFHDWLPKVIPSVTPFVSTEIEKGTRWHQKIADELEKTSFGLVCVTPQNIKSPWIHYEAGAISKLIDDSHVCPILLGLGTSKLDGPLAEFQYTADDALDIKRLVITINKACGDEGVNSKELQAALVKHLPELQKSLRSLCRSISSNKTRSVLDRVEDWLTMIGFNWFSIVILILGSMMMIIRMREESHYRDPYIEKLWRAKGVLKKLEYKDEEKRLGDSDTIQPDQIVCLYEFEYDGKKHEGTSVNFTKNVPLSLRLFVKLRQSIGKSVKVYFDPDDPSKCGIQMDLRHRAPNWTSLFIPAGITLAVLGLWFLIRRGPRLGS